MKKKNLFYLIIVLSAGLFASSHLLFGNEAKDTCQLVTCYQDPCRYPNTGYACVLTQPSFWNQQTCTIYDINCFD
jgi:hypothetical protein